MGKKRAEKIITKNLNELKVVDEQENTKVEPKRAQEEEEGKKNEGNELKFEPPDLFELIEEREDKGGSRQPDQHEADLDHPEEAFEIYTADNVPYV